MGREAKAIEHQRAAARAAKLPDIKVDAIREDVGNKTERMSLVATLYLTGRYTQEDIAYKLKDYGYDVCSTAVGKDITKLQSLWKRSAMRSTEQWITKEIARLDDLEFEAVTKLREFKCVVHVHVNEEWEEHRKEEVERKAVEKWINATAKYIDAVLSIQNRRAKLLGLDKQVDSANSGATFNVSNVTIQQVTRLTNAQLEEVIRNRGIVPREDRQLPQRSAAGSREEEAAI